MSADTNTTTTPAGGAAPPPDTSKTAPPAAAAPPPDTSKTAPPPAAAPPPDKTQPAVAAASPDTDLAQRVAELDAQLKASNARAKRQAIKLAMPDLIDDDLLSSAPSVDLTELGDLTTASKAKLDEWRKTKPHFFRAAQAAGDAATRTTPGQQAGAALGQLSDFDKARLENAGVPVHDLTKVPNAARVINVLFGTGSRRGGVQ